MKALLMTYGRQDTESQIQMTFKTLNMALYGMKLTPHSKLIEISALVIQPKISK